MKVDNAEINDVLSMENMLCFDVYSAHQAFGQAYKKYLEPLGLTYPQYLVLVVLWSDGSSSIGRIGSKIGLESNTLTPLIKRMEAAGLVERRRDATDERRVVVSLTARGRALEKDTADIPECMSRTTGLSEREFKSLHKLLTKLKQGLRAS